MSRHFLTSKGADWLTMYQNYAEDGFCPTAFHTWAGIVTLAAACERRIWIDHGRYQTYGNIYILLISRPGVGKSTAINSSQAILRGLRGRSPEDKGINFISQQSSEAGFYDPQFKRKKEFYVQNDKKSQSPGFIIFSEAANSMKEMPGGGNIMKALTEFYDCPSYWSKSLTKQETLELTNICPTLLGACTFSDLPDIIPSRNLEGGLASRFIYIPEFERKIRTPSFKTTSMNEIVKQKLIEDLQVIYSKSGEMHMDPDFYQDWSRLHGESDEALNKATNSHLECLLARRFLNIEKLSILIALSETDNTIITGKHWERATSFFDAQAKHLPKILEFSSVTDDQKSMTDAIVRFVSSGTYTVKQTRRFMLDKGLDPFRINANIEFMLKNDSLIELPDGTVRAEVRMNNQANLLKSMDVLDVEPETLQTEFRE